MTEVKTEQEPSIEEILESIRQIISEDGEAETKPAPESKLELVQPAPAPVPPSDLSLTPKPEKPAPQPAPVAAAPAPAKVEEKPFEAPLDLTEKIAPVPLELKQPEPPQQSSVTIEMMDSPMTTNEKPESLVSSEAATAAADSLSKLLAANVTLEADGVRPAGKVTLEEMVRDLMKPLIKTWLDQNLPGVVEKIVQKEVEKLSRRAADR